MDRRYYDNSKVNYERLLNQRVASVFFLKKDDFLRHFTKSQNLTLYISTRRLVNVRSHIMFRPELIYIFDLIVNQMKR